MMIGLMCLKKLILTKQWLAKVYCLSLLVLEIILRFQPKERDGCHDLMQKAILLTMFKLFLL